VANSVFRSTGGQSVDTSHSMAQSDFSQAGPGSIDTDEVDPVAEADVYMAYGRDAQAEEILLEAKQKDPAALCHSSEAARNLS
jgi:pilus assembly protein FimV